MSFSLTRSLANFQRICDIFAFVTPSQATNHYFHRAADLLQLNDRTRRQLITPYREIKVELTLWQENGTQEPTPASAFNTTTPADP